MVPVYKVLVTRFYLSEVKLTPVFRAEDKRVRHSRPPHLTPCARTFAPWREVTAAPSPMPAQPSRTAPTLAPPCRPGFSSDGHVAKSEEGFLFLVFDKAFFTIEKFQN